MDFSRFPLVDSPVGDQSFDSEGKAKHIRFQNGYVLVFKKDDPSREPTAVYRLGEPAVPQQPPQDLDLPRWNAEYAQIVARWEASRCCENLIRLFADKILGTEGFKITSCIYVDFFTFTGLDPNPVGVDDLSDVDPTSQLSAISTRPSAPDDKLLAAYQLAAFETMVRVLRERPATSTQEGAGGSANGAIRAQPCDRYGLLPERYHEQLR